MARTTIGTWAKGCEATVPGQYRDKAEIRLTGSEDDTGIDDVTITMSYETNA